MTYVSKSLKVRFKMTAITTRHRGVYSYQRLSIDSSNAIEKGANITHEDGMMKRIMSGLMYTLITVWSGCDESNCENWKEVKCHGDYIATCSLKGWYGFIWREGVNCVQYGAVCRSDIQALENEEVWHYADNTACIYENTVCEPGQKRMCQGLFIATCLELDQAPVFDGTDCSEQGYCIEDASTGEAFCAYANEPCPEPGAARCLDLGAVVRCAQGYWTELEPCDSGMTCQNTEHGPMCVYEQGED